MRESIFRFKQFSIKNDASSMKVGTDGVLLGAWCACNETTQSVLDIGAGTGLISLMIAQRAVNANIIGIEIDEPAYKEAEYNFALSKWGKRLNAINTDFVEFAKMYNKTFDLIVSNPPYFDNGILASKSGRALARHELSLSLESLFVNSARLLACGGKIAVVYPYSSFSKMKDCAQDAGLYLSRYTKVFSTADSPEPKRILCEFTTTSSPIKVDNLIIEIERHVYTQDYIRLTKDFYLKM